MREQMPQMPVSFEEQPNSSEQLPQENEQEKMLEKLTGLVGDVYAERLDKKVQAGEATAVEIGASLKDNLDHVGQVKDNVDFIIDEIKAGRMTDEIIPRDENGQAIFDDRVLKTMTVLHDVAKINEKGDLDTFHHHDRDKVEKILVDEQSKVHEFLKNNGFAPEEIAFMVDGIERHSRRTDFIARYFDNRKRQEIADLPRPEGVLEHVILSDADILTQSRLEQGVKKIVCSRLTTEFFRQTDTIDGQHSFAKTLSSTLDSAKKVAEAMHFKVTKEKNAQQLDQVLSFATWLEDKQKVVELDEIGRERLQELALEKSTKTFGSEDEKIAWEKKEVIERNKIFVAKKKRFDELILEFLDTTQTK